MEQQVHIPKLGHITVETIMLTDIQLDVFNVIRNAPKCSMMKGRPALTAAGVCGALGHSGYVREVYDAVRELHKMGLVKQGYTYTDSIYYV